MKYALFVVAALAACSKSTEHDRTASATLDAKSGSAITGHVEATEASGGVNFTITISGADPGRHGVHLHANGDCSDRDAKSAGDHWNPDQSAHGGPHATVRHAGDLGNIEVGADGRGIARVFMKGLTIEPSDRSVIDRAVVVHAAADDLTSQPAGNSGARIACGVLLRRLK